MTRIPMRPADKSVCKGLTEMEMDALTYYVVSGCSKEYAQEHFVMIEYKVTKAALTRTANQFFGRKESQDYLRAYKQTLESFFDSFKEVPAEHHAATVETPAVLTEEMMKSRKITAVQKILNYVVEQANDIGNVEDPETLVKIADKVGLFDDFEKAVESPRRYLPETCLRSCRYRLFCEDNMVNGNIVDECVYCKYKAYANKNGVMYDNTNMLDIPKSQADTPKSENKRK